MARLFTSGFESNSLVTDVEFSTISGTPTLVTSPVRSGTYALRTNTASGTSFVRKELFASDQSIVGYQRIYIQLASLPSVNTAVLRFLTTANTNAASIRLSTTGTLQLLNGASATVGAASATLSLGTWYMIELMLDSTTNPGTVEARLDGVVFASGANNAQLSWGRVACGSLTTSVADIYFDDWAVNDTAGSYQNSYPGSGKVIQLMPNGAGDNTQWEIGGTTPAATNWESVDEVPPNDATDFVRANTATTSDFYNVTNGGLSNVDTVNVVHVGGRFRNNIVDAVTGFRFELKKVSGGTVVQSAEIVPNSGTWRTHSIAVPYIYPITTYQDPDATNWSNITIDSMQIGYRLTTAGTNYIQVGTTWALVDYTPGVALPPSSTYSTQLMMGV